MPPTRTTTVLWLVDEEVRVSEPPSAAAVRHIRPDRRFPAAAVARVIGDGPLLAVVETDEEAQRVLAMGADDVLLVGELTPETYERALARMASRGRGRENRDLYLLDLLRHDDTFALELVTSSVGQQLLAPLARVSADAQHVARGLPRRGTVGGGPTDLPTGGGLELRERAEGIAATLSDMSVVLEQMGSLLDTDAGGECTDAATTIAEIAGLLEPTVGRTAEFVVELPAPGCLVGLPRWQLVQVVTTLIANAVDAVSASTSASGHEIALRLLIHDGVAVIEVTDDGAGMAPEVRPRALDPFFSTRGADKKGLALALTRSRVCRAGGEVMIDSRIDEGTAVRVFLPLVEPVRVPKPQTSFS